MEMQPYPTAIPDDQFVDLEKGEFAGNSVDSPLNSDDPAPNDGD
jgi:hypothetical protein